MADSFTEYLAEGDGHLSFRVNEGTISICSVMAQRVKIFATGTGMHAMGFKLPWV